MIRKRPQKRKKFSISKLERSAFPDHPVTLAELREAAYAEQLGEPIVDPLRSHIAKCAFCQEQLALLRQSDPILTGEDESRIKVLVEAIENPDLASAIEVQAQSAFASIANHHGNRAAVTAAEIVDALVSEEETNIDEAEVAETAEEQTDRVAFGRMSRG